MRKSCLLVVGVLLLTTVAAAEFQECTVTREDKLVCPPIRRQDPSLPAPRQMFTGRVTAVLDSDTLQIETQGKRMRVRLRHGWPGITREDLTEVALHRQVSVYIREREGEQTVVADVLVGPGENLINVLNEATRQKPHIIKIRQQEAEVRLRTAADQAQKQAEAQAQQQAARVKVEQAAKKPLDKAFVCAPAHGGKGCQYTIPGLAGIILDNLTFWQHGWGAAEITSTLHNVSGAPLQQLVLTVEWWQFGSPADTTSTMAVGYDPLPPGSAKAVKMLTLAPSAQYTDDYRISARWPGHPQPGPNPTRVSPAAKSPCVTVTGISAK